MDSFTKENGINQKEAERQHLQGVVGIQIQNAAYELEQKEAELAKFDRSGRDFAQMQASYPIFQEVRSLEGKLTELKERHRRLAIHPDEAKECLPYWVK